MAVTALICVALGTSAQTAAPSLSNIQAPQKCTLSGTVVDAVSGDPLNKVNLSLEPADRGSALIVTSVTVSDEKGHFEMVDLGAGVYRLKGARSGYLETAYGSHRLGAEGARVRLEAGQNLADVTLKLTPGGAIAGMVRDSDGEPLESAYVTLARFTYEQGVRAVRREAATTTDDRGEYRFHGLAAGKYYIGVEAGALDFPFRVDRSGKPASAEMSIPTIYPNVNDLALATPVEVAPGRRVSGVDVTMIRSRVFRVAGRVLNLPGRVVSVELEDARNSGIRDHPLRASTRNASGDFEFRGVPPGIYYVNTVADSNHIGTRIDVGDADIEGVRLTLQPGATIEKLQIAAEGDEKPDASGISMQLSEPNGRGYSVISMFGRGGVTAGRYPVVRFSGGLLRRFYVKSARAGDADILADGLTVPAGGRVQVAVMLASDGAKLEGIVRNAKEELAPGATVALVPNTRDRIYFFQTTTSDQNAHFEFTAIPPGGYAVFAWDDVEPGSWYDPDFLRIYEKRAQQTALGSRENKTIDLHLAIPPDGQ